MSIKYLKSSNIKNKTVLVRVDVNVPLNKETGKVEDSFRIEAIIPTIRHLQKNKNKIILCGHLGRPKGARDEKFSLRPIAKYLSKFFNLEFSEAKNQILESATPRVIFYEGDFIVKRFENVKAEDLVLLENLRFYKGEEENDSVLGKKMANLADVYVNDAFGVDHRKAASVCAVTKYIPSYAGLLLEKEIKFLDLVLNKPKKPFVAMMGGIKISDKVLTLENLGKRADKILLGGGIANLFFLSKGYEIGISKVEKEAVKAAWQIEKNFKSKIVLPLDLVVANEKMERSSIRVVDPHLVGKNEQVLDCGPKTILEFAKYLKAAKTIIWNGPLGLFEVKPFHTATMALCRVIGGVATRKAFAVVGGGETVDAVRQAGQENHIDHVSTGGGAMLEYLAGEKLPGIEALK
jgi:phosphoglycerate kinase